MYLVWRVDHFNIFACCICATFVHRSCRSPFWVFGLFQNDLILGTFLEDLKIAHDIMHIVYNQRTSICVYIIKTHIASMFSVCAYYVWRYVYGAMLFACRLWLWWLQRLCLWRLYQLPTASRQVTHTNVPVLFMHCSTFCSIHV